MTDTMLRRKLLLLLAAAPLAHAVDHGGMGKEPHADLAALEKAAGGRLGVAVLDTGSGRQVLYRADERFAFCSTFKAMAAAAILARSAREPDLLARRIRYTKQDLVTYSPETEDHVDDGMTVAELCQATVQLSDNSAGNFLLKVLGGPAALTAYARSIGDREFRLDRWEAELNSAIPGDPRDTTTPQAMMRSMRRLLLGDALPAPQRKQLVDWMTGTLTGNERIRAGCPAGAVVADKTGSGAYGMTNDIGVIWPQGGAPLAIAVYYAGPQKDSHTRSDVIAAATKITLAALLGS